MYLLAFDKYIIRFNVFVVKYKPILNKLMQQIKKKILPWFTRLHVIPNLNDFLSSMENKPWYFEECWGPNKTEVQYTFINYVYMHTNNPFHNQIDGSSCKHLNWSDDETVK